MKYLISILLLTTLCGSVYAENSMNEEIERIMKAPQKERVELMNQFKTKLANLNEQERKEAIQKLQLGINGDAASHKGQNMSMHQMRSSVQQQQQQQQQRMNSSQPRNKR
jgi:hypothetical protein